MKLPLLPRRALFKLGQHEEFPAEAWSAYRTRQGISFYTVWQYKEHIFIYLQTGKGVRVSSRLTSMFTNVQILNAGNVSPHVLQAGADRIITSVGQTHARADRHCQVEENLVLEAVFGPARAPAALTDSVVESDAELAVGPAAASAPAHLAAGCEQFSSEEESDGHEEQGAADEDGVEAELEVVTKRQRLGMF